ncbi:hypothetical protein B0H14DRAFT_2602194 [Mycena olivaceomarginata]|nr:hypothetical protein B0H14DRAFT_2602194 [Mycena olivaceomarginata]
MSLTHFEDVKLTEHRVPFQSRVNLHLGSTVQLGSLGGGFLSFLGENGYCGCQLTSWFNSVQRVQLFHYFPVRTDTVTCQLTSWFNRATRFIRTALANFEDIKPTQYQVPFQAGVNSHLGSTRFNMRNFFIIFRCEWILTSNSRNIEFLSSHVSTHILVQPSNSVHRVQGSYHLWVRRDTVLPRPVVINVPPIETQRTQHRAKPSPASPVKRPAPDPEQEVQWTSWTDELADIVLRPVSPVDEDIETEDPAAEKETLAQDAERARVWEIVVSLAVEGMREPDRRAWFRDQHMQEKRELQEQRDRQGNIFDCVESFSDWLGPEEYIETQRSAPSLQTIAQLESVPSWVVRERSMPSDELTRHRELEPACKPPTSSAHEVHETDPDTLRRKRLVADLDRMRRESVLRRLPGQQLFIPLLPGSRTVSPTTPSLTTTPHAKPAIDPSSMAGIPAFYREPDWSEASDDDEYDPASPLPYCPHWNISTRRLDAIWTAATTTTPKKLAAREKEQARLAANCAQARRAQKKRAMAEQRAVGNYLNYIFLKEFTIGLLLHRLGESISVLACRQTTKIGTLTSTVSWVATGTEVRFVRTFQEGLAYLGVGVEDDRHFWVVNGDAMIHRSSGFSAAAFQAWKDSKDSWASIFVTSLEEDVESYDLQFDSEKRVALLSVLSRPQPRWAAQHRWAGFRFEPKALGSLMAAPPPKSKAARPLKSPIPFEMFLRVVAFCPLRERAVITRLCKQLLPLFRHITNARKLIHSLANNPSLPPLVISLIFADDATSVEVSEWTIVLPTLVNLWRLGITSRIPLPPDLMRSLPFRLTCFQATCAIGGAWKDFVASQPGLGELYLEDVARFVQTHPLCDAWFFTGAPLGKETLLAVDLTHFDNTEYCLTTLRISASDFLLLSAAAPEFVEVLRHLVLDEDLTWSDFTLESGADCVAGSTFGRVATTLDGQYIHLMSVLLFRIEPLISSTATGPEPDVMNACGLLISDFVIMYPINNSGKMHLIFNAESVFSHYPFLLWGRTSDAPLPTPARITPAPTVPRCVKVYFTKQMARPLNVHGRNRDVSESRRRFFETSDLFGISLGLIHANPVDSNALEEDYDDMPALEDDLSDNSCCVDSLKSKL